MSDSKSYVRPDDRATIVEVEPHRYVNAKLRLQGPHPAGQTHDEAAAVSHASPQRSELHDRQLVEPPGH